MLTYLWVYFLQLVWLFLPAGAANMLAGLSKKFPVLDYPVDGGRYWRGKRIFGDHKTWRGFVFGLFGGILTAYIQASFYSPYNIYYLVDYSKINFWYWGLLSGLGALLGDLVRSFFKRRVNILPGKIWFPFDQIDWIIGAIIFMSFYVRISWLNIIVAIALSTVIHPFINYICYLLRIQKNKF